MTYNVLLLYYNIMDCTPEIDTSENHRESSEALSKGFSVAFSNGISLFSCIFQRIITFPVDLYWNCPRDFQWHFPRDFTSVTSGVQSFAPSLAHAVLDTEPRVALTPVVLTADGAGCDAVDAW